VELASGTHEVDDDAPELLVVTRLEAWDAEEVEREAVAVAGLGPDVRVLEVMTEEVPGEPRAVDEVAGPAPENTKKYATAAATKTSASTATAVTVAATAGSSILNDGGACRGPYLASSSCHLRPAL
jgi:hypothetical protein